MDKKIIHNSQNSEYRKKTSLFLSILSIKCILLSPKQKSQNLIESKMCSVQGNSAQFLEFYIFVWERFILRLVIKARRNVCRIIREMPGPQTRNTGPSHNDANLFSFLLKVILYTMRTLSLEKGRCFFPPEKIQMYVWEVSKCPLFCCCWPTYFYWYIPTIWRRGRDNMVIG